MHVLLIKNYSIKNVRKHASNANDGFIKYCILLVMILNNRLFEYFDDICEVYACNKYLVTFI